MTISKLTSCTLHTRKDISTGIWVTSCLQCGHEILTNSKDESIIEFVGHDCEDINV